MADIVGTAIANAALGLAPNGQIFNQRLVPLTITNPQALGAWRRAYSNEYHAESSIVCYGNSVVWGYGCNGGGNTENSVFQSLAWPEQLRRKFMESCNGRGGGFYPMIQSGVNIPAAPTNLNYVTYNLTSGNPSNGLVGPNCIFFPLKSTAFPGTVDSVTFTVPIGTSVIKVFNYVNDGGDGNGISGAWEYSIDGGSATVVPAPASSGTPTVNTQCFTVTTVATGLSLTATHTVTITATTTSNVYIGGVFWGTGNGISVFRVGRSGWMLNDALGQGQVNGPGGANAAAIATDASVDGSNYLRLLRAQAAFNGPGGTAVLYAISYDINNYIYQTTVGTNGGVVTVNTTALSGPASPANFLALMTEYCNQITKGSKNLVNAAYTQATVLIFNQNWTDCIPGSTIPYVGAQTTPETWKQDQYWQQCEAIAASNPNVCSVRLSKLWSGEASDVTESCNFTASASTINAIFTLNVTAVASGSLYAGGILGYTGYLSKNTILAQLTGTPGGIGTYKLAAALTVGSTSMSFYDKPGYCIPNANGLMVDMTHPNANGHGDIAELLFRILTQATFPDALFS